MHLNITNLNKGSHGLKTLNYPCLGDLIGYVDMSREVR